MEFAGINYLAVVLAAAVGFGVGGLWYWALGPIWLAAQGKTSADITPRPGPFIVAAVAQLLMAYILAGTIGHLGAVTLVNGVVTAALIWLGFVATTISVNHGFQGRSVSLTLVDAGHWLAVMVLMGAVIGLIGV